MARLQAAAKQHEAAVALNGRLLLIAEQQCQVLAMARDKCSQPGSLSQVDALRLEVCVECGWRP